MSFDNDFVQYGHHLVYHSQCLSPRFNFQVAPTIKQRMVEQGTMLIGYQPDGDRVNFFRMVVSNTAATFEDMDFVVSEITRLGQDL